jgi:signal transduction histidine kinase
VLHQFIVTHRQEIITRCHAKVAEACQSIAELATETQTEISAVDLNALNQYLDHAIAEAVTEYGRKEGPATAAMAADPDADRLGFFVHELRNLVNTAILSFEVLRAGNMTVGAGTGTVLHRSLFGLRALITRSLEEVRLTQAVQNKEPILLAGLIGEVAAAATLQARTTGLRLTVLPVDPDVVIDGDRQVLAAAVGNLLQNAFKFTRPHSAVILRARGKDDRVLIEVEDECGGLPGQHPEELFRAFEQQGADRTGLGLGLASSRQGVEANRGRIYARSLPDRGCVFTVDLPRLGEPISQATD